MGTPEKSSDEILQELFGLCLQSQYNDNKSNESSQESSSIDSDNIKKQKVSNKKRKHKRRKKKHKKEKKRLRSSSVDKDTVSIENKIPHKHKKNKSHKENHKNCKNNSNSPKNKIKMESKLEQLSCCKQSNPTESTDNETLDTAVTKVMSIDDVFTTLGIISENKISNENINQSKNNDVKNNVDENSQSNTPEKIIENSSSKSPNKEIQKQSEESFESCKLTTEKHSTQTNKDLVFEIFSPNKDSKFSSGIKKINIKNLKNSVVYETTIQEIQEREKLKIAKFENSQLSSSSSTDDNNELSSQKENNSRKRRKRSRSKSSRNKHNSHHRKSKRRRRSNDGHRRSRSFDKNHYNTGNCIDNHHYHHYRSRSRSRTPPRGYHKSRSKKRDRSSGKFHSRSKTRSRERKSRSVEKIDKQKLLEIARKNAINLLKQGSMPASVVVNADKIASIKAGGKTVDELTDFCKQLSKKDAEGVSSSHSDSDIDSSEEKETPFHHPFQLKEKPSSIVMNIRNAIPLPTKTAQEKTLELSKQLSLQFPVSSGQQHRKNENEWVPVEKPPETPKASNAIALTTPATKNFMPSYDSTVSSMDINYGPLMLNNVVQNPVPIQNPPVDIGSIVAQRLEAIRRLTENPQDPVGTNLIQAVDTKMQVWAESKVQPGLFTGSTGVRTLTAAELSSGYTAWAKKSQFKNVKPVYSDKGEALMKKMGWQPGEGLGKYKQGPSAPCEINMKTDRKGLAEQPLPKTFNQTSLKKAMEICLNKHPVSLLNEYCSRKKIGVPQYDCEEKEGAGRRKLYLFTVTVDGNRYIPKMPCLNKKQSKVEAATICLQSLGILPLTVPASST